MPYELKKTSAGKFMFNLKARNHEIILTSESYEAKASALNGIASVQENGTIEERFDRRTASDGSPYFVLKARNGEIIGKSEMYSGTSARDNGIESVKANAASTEINDKTQA